MLNIITKEGKLDPMIVKKLIRDDTYSGYYREVVEYLKRHEEKVNILYKENEMKYKQIQDILENLIYEKEKIKLMIEENQLQLNQMKIYLEPKNVLKMLNHPDSLNISFAPGINGDYQVHFIRNKFEFNIKSLSYIIHSEEKRLLFIEKEIQLKKEELSRIYNYNSWMKNQEKDLAIRYKEENLFDHKLNEEEDLFRIYNKSFLK